MGTSQSSSGPASGVSLIPPWADADGPSEVVDDPAPANPIAAPIAQDRRFRDARRALNGFATTGNSTYIPRALGHYVSSGYGGAQTLARRMGSTARSAHRLGMALGGAGGASARFGGIDLSTATADEILEAIVDSVAPIDGTQDAETARNSTDRALSDMLDRFPDADLSSLGDVEREFVIERFLVHDVFARVQLDVGETISKHAPTPSIASQRFMEIRQYIANGVSAAVERSRASGGTFVMSNTLSIVRQVLLDTFTVFEGYAS